MTRVLVLYHSMHGHIETMAEEAAAGVRETGAEAVVKRVPETMSAEALENAGAKTDQAAPVAEPGELKDFDAILIGTPTRFGNMSGQMRNFLDQTGALWANGELVAKVGSVFTSSATGGGNESTILSAQITLMHHGMVVVGLPYAVAGELFDISEARGGSPYGAGMLAGPDGARQPSALERTLVRKQGAHVARIAAQLRHGRAALDRAA